MIASGSSERGLSEVTTARSESRARDLAHLAAACRGRGRRRRRRPQISRPSVSTRAARRTFSSESGRVGVVDQHGERLPLVDRLEAARDPVRIAERRRRGVAGDAERVRRRRAPPARSRR